MIATLWSLLVECTVATSAAVVLAWLLRGALARRFGFSAAHALWSVVPLSLVAVLLPAPNVDAVAVVALGLLQAQAVAEGASDPVVAASGWLLAAWGLGAVATLLVQLHRQRRFTAGLGSLQRRDDGLYVAASNGGGLPAVAGLLRQRIIVGFAFDSQYTAQERELVLYHERVHVRRGDLHANALAMLLRAMFWFNPLLHMAARRFRQDQELACDEAVIARFPHSRRAYADAMLKTQLAARPLPLACHWTGAHPLKERIAMLKNPVPTPRRAAAGSLAVLLLCAAASVAAWAAQPPAAADPKPAAQPMPDGMQRSPPVYPKAAAEGGIGGRVMLLVDVAPDGKVIGAVVESSEPAGVFDEYALQSVRTWRFNPAIKDGIPMSTRVRVPVEFRPDAAPSTPGSGSGADKS